MRPSFRPFCAVRTRLVRHASRRGAARCGSAGLFAALCLCGTALAADPPAKTDAGAKPAPAAKKAPADPKRLAAVRLEDVDEDFAFQGEYFGYHRDVQSGRFVNAGLQVVARGGGKFFAAYLAGGLPGYGWTGATRIALEGARDGGVVTLTGPAFVVAVANGAADVSDSSGRSLGRLAKVSRTSPTLGARPPYGAKVLFDGTSTEHFKNGKMSADGLLEVGCDFLEPIADFSLHLEFKLPYMPYARDQGRANSGVYLQSRYEVQILDSFGLEGVENECGSLYRQRRPALNMCLPPLSWQTYDLVFRSAAFDEAGKKVRPARITLLHNGVAVHSDYDIENKTGAGAPEGPQVLVTKLQNHGNPVQFRNIWLVEHRAMPATPAPVAAAAGCAPVVATCTPCPPVVTCWCRKCRRHRCDDDD